MIAVFVLSTGGLVVASTSDSKFYLERHAPQPPWRMVLERATPADELAYLVLRRMEGLEEKIEKVVRVSMPSVSNSFTNMAIETAIQPPKLRLQEAEEPSSTDWSESSISSWFTIGTGSPEMESSTVILPSGNGSGRFSMPVSSVNSVTQSGPADSPVSPPFPISDGIFPSSQVPWVSVPIRGGASNIYMPIPYPFQQGIPSSPTSKSTVIYSQPPPYGQPSSSK